MTNPGKTLHILLGSIIESKPVAKEGDLKRSTSATERFVTFKAAESWKGAATLYQRDVPNSVNIHWSETLIKFCSEPQL